MRPFLRQGRAVTKHTRDKLLGMGVDRRTFLTLVGAAPAVTLASCQQVDTSPPKPWPAIKALRELALDDVEPAIVFAPLRRQP